MDKLLLYFLELQKIKDVKRYALHHKVFCESVADHSYFMVLMATKFFDELKLDLDFKKTIKLITYHDVCELGMQTDYDAVKAKSDKSYNELKESDEIANIDRLTKQYDKEILDLYNEYVSQNTREAKFVKALDKLEANIYEIMRGAKYFDSADFIATYPNNAVKEFPELLPFLRILQKYMKTEYKKAGHPWKKQYELIINSQRKQSISNNMI